MKKIVLVLALAASLVFTANAQKQPATPWKIVDMELVSKHGGKIGADVLGNITSIRISMAKEVDGNEEPWETQFGEVTIF